MPPASLSLSPSPSIFKHSVSPLSPSAFSPSTSIAPSPSPTQATTPAHPPIPAFNLPKSNPSQFPPPASIPNQTVKNNSKLNNRHIAGIFLGSSLFICLSAVGILYFRRNKKVTVKPWTSGLSGQLQKAFVTGLPKLQRSELETACEDFSNIVGSLSDGMVYKGTLSSGVEIAVVSTILKSAVDWTNTLEDQFRNKITVLSKVNHKNFVNLIGYCEEEEPFTRMLVFEYAPNGTLYEHLHIREAEHLDWRTRLRIATGIAYCLEHMHQLTPPVAHINLQSSSIYLTEDYAAKLSDFSWNEVTAAAKTGSATTKLLETQSTDLDSNIYSFGEILFEMITGRIPYSNDNDDYIDEISDYMRGIRISSEMVDPTLKSFSEEELNKLFQLMKDCLDPISKQRPTMVEITTRLKEIAAMGPEGATPKVSPLWWAELEILSPELS